MPFKAQLPSGQVRHIRECTRADGPFTCQNGCGPMSYVQGEVRQTAHFRHHVACTCSWEPETDDHETAKEVVCHTINQSGRGAADVEVRAGKFIADVMWTHNGQRIAFEIQRANYPWATFREKIDGYSDQGIATVYLFIGPDFYRGGSPKELRIKEVEHSLAVGAVEFCEHRHRSSSITHTPEFLRIRRQLPPRITAGYLRREKEVRESLLVREPIFYPAITKDAWPKQNHVWEFGSSISPLAEYLETVGDAFFAPPGTPFLWGRRFGVQPDANWAYFFARLGLKWRYESHADNEPGTFTLSTPHGRRELLASVGAGPDCDPEDAFFLRLDSQPHLEADLCCVGDLAFNGSSDTAVVASYGGTEDLIVDFSQLGNDYSGAMTGKHDGGFPGGAEGKELAAEAMELWRDGNALLNTGCSYPLRFPVFKWPVRPCPIQWPVPAARNTTTPHPQFFSKGVHHS